MVRAVGFSHNEFNPSDPGRLCRGRERWIEPWSVDESPDDLCRLVVSGASFDDDSARDAMRGVDHGGLDMVAVLSVLYPRREFLAFTEDGHPADIPEDAEQVELYETHRAGGREMVTGVRWVKRISGVHNLRVLLSGESGVERVRGFVVLKTGAEIEPLIEPLFLLVGMSTLDSPPARFQPMALPELLEQVEAVILLHRDKHGHSLGVYTKTPVDAAKKLRTLAEKKGSLLISFAIPPMLARWDRALAEARIEWDASHDEPFPVPQSDRPYAWDRRRKNRRRRGDDDDDTRSDDETTGGDDASDDDTSDDSVDDALNDEPSEDNDRSDDDDSSDDDRNVDDDDTGSVFDGDDFDFDDFLIES